MCKYARITNRNIINFFQVSKLSWFQCNMISESKTLSNINNLTWSGTFWAPGSGLSKSKTSNKIIRKSYLNFLREDIYLCKKTCNMAVFQSYMIRYMRKNLVSSHINKIQAKILKNFDKAGSGISKIGSGPKFSGSAILKEDEVSTAVLSPSSILHFVVWKLGNKRSIKFVRNIIY